jgi:hypothetical protein
LHNCWTPWEQFVFVVNKDFCFSDALGLSEKSQKSQKESETKIIKVGLGFWFVCLVFGSTGIWT